MFLCKERIGTLVIGMKQGLNKKSSQVDRYEELIQRLITEGYNMVEIQDVIEKQYQIVLKYTTLKAWINKRPAFKSALETAQKIRKEADYRSILDKPPAKELEIMIEAGQSSNEFINKLVTEYGPDSKEDGEDRSALNYGYVSFIILCRAVLILTNKATNILEVRAAQKVYNDQIGFLQELERKETGSFSQIEFNINPNDEIEPDKYADFMAVINGAKKISTVNTDQQSLFE